MFPPIAKGSMAFLRSLPEDPQVSNIKAFINFGNESARSTAGFIGPIVVYHSYVTKQKM